MEEIEQIQHLLNRLMTKAHNTEEKVEALARHLGLKFQISTELAGKYKVKGYKDEGETQD